MSISLPSVKIKYFILFSVIHILTANGQEHRCDVPLGMESGDISSSQLSSSIVTSDPNQGRLNGASAWCFRDTDPELPSTVEFTIDLGRVTLLSAIVTQGPTAAFALKTFDSSDYTRHSGFSLWNTTSNAQNASFQFCCDDSEITYYTEVKPGEEDETTIHPLSQLILARQVRLLFKTDVRYAGNENKCFRFEILGCPAAAIPNTELALTAVPSGWLQATWRQPYVIVRNNTASRNLSLSVEGFYKTIVVRTGASQPLLTSASEVDATRLMIPGPVWGAQYKVSVSVIHQGIELSCGSVVISSATVPGCDPQDPDCALEDQVVFRKPLKVTAESVTEGGVTKGVDLGWDAEGPGWVTSFTDLSITDSFNTAIFSTEIDLQANSQFVTSLQPGESYTVAFTPKGTGLAYVPTFTYELFLVPWSSVDGSDRSTGYGAFITDVHLLLSIIWNGTLRVSWRSATVRDKNDGIIPTAPPTTVIPETVAADLNGTDEGVTDPIVAATDPAPVETAAVEPVAAVAEDLNSEATAMAYNVTLINDVTEERIETKVVPHLDGTNLMTMFPDLMLETFYKVVLHCDFGDMISECGSSKIYTALPLSWVKMESQLLLYDMNEAGDTWKNQEATCQRSGGNLVSLSTAEENELIGPSLKMGQPKTTFDHFWLGLYMCQDAGQGSLWSDGSPWGISRLPSVDSGLSGATCCIKNERDLTSLAYSWRGESCEALLPAVCEFKLDGLVGTILDLNRAGANTTWARLEWGFSQKFWQMSRQILTICPIRRMDFDKKDLSDATCMERQISPQAREFIVDNLLPLTEYQVGITAALTPIKYQSPVVNTTVRTYHEEPTLTVFDSDGFFKFMWADKVAEYKDNEPVSVSFEKDGKSVFSNKDYPASGGLIGDMELGKTYKFTMKETTGDQKAVTVEYQAYPPCPCTDCTMIDGWCHLASPSGSISDDAKSQCELVDAVVAPVITKARFGQILDIATKESDGLWVSSFSTKGAILAPDELSAALVSDPDAELISDVAEEAIVTNPPPSGVAGSDGLECLLLSPTEKSIIAADCSEIHKSACVVRPKITGTVPQQLSDLEVIASGTTIQINFKKEAGIQNGWKSKYFVYYQRSIEGSRFKRALQYETFDDTPFTLRTLQMNTEYDVEIENSVSQGFTELSPTFNIKTTNYTTSADLQTSSVVMAGWPPSEQHRILQLVCGSILIAACIITMLLFFATGMFYQDCMAQLGFEASLLISYFILILAHPIFVTNEDSTICTVIAVLLHFTFMCCFLFLMFEALTIGHLLVTPIKSPFQASNWILVLIGIAIPFIYVLIMGGSLNTRYINIPEHNCWLDDGGAPIYLEVFPNVIIFLVTMGLLIASLLIKDTPPELIEVNLRGRQRDTHKLRWIVGAEAILLLMVWSIGVGAYNTRNGGTHVTFNIFTLILALVILFFRTYFDDTFRSKMHRLCCGTELTYKRSDVFSISSASNKVKPAMLNTTQNGVNSTTVKASTTSVKPDYTLPHTPPSSKESSTVLIKRSYNFVDE